MSHPRSVPLTVPNGASASAGLLLSDASLVGVVQPAALDGTTWYLQGSYDGGVTFGNIDESDGTQTLVTFSTSAVAKNYASDQLPAVIRIATTTQQTADRKFYVLVKDL